MRPHVICRETMRRVQQEEKDKDAREFEQGGGMQEVSEEKTEKYEGAAGTALPSRWRGRLLLVRGKVGWTLHILAFDFTPAACFDIARARHRIIGKELGGHIHTLAFVVKRCVRGTSVSQ